MVELHSKVPHIRKMPAKKHVATNTGTLRVCMQIRLQRINAMQQVSNEVLEAKRNFNRNMMVNVSDMPTIEAYPAIIISSRSKAVEPAISLTAAK